MIDPKKLHEIGFHHLPVVQKLYEEWQVTPHAVPPEWASSFAFYAEETSEKGIQAYATKQKVVEWIEAYRKKGHLQARISPLYPPGKTKALCLETYGLETCDLEKPFPTCGLFKEPTLPLQRLQERLEELYCGSVGIEFRGLVAPDVEAWLLEEIEQKKALTTTSKDEKEKILEALTRSELFETFLHLRYPGQKRFSLEGEETFIPVLQALIETSASLDVQQFVLGMAHRGRLNVLCNVMNKSFEEVFSEFSNTAPTTFQKRGGDVKYHKGYRSYFHTSQGRPVSLILSDNPSHLESVAPVILGFVRSGQERGESVLPILVHGDAAISGQGVVYETMQLTRLKGYQTKGAVHIVLNNEIGFTTLPQESRSTTYCTDIAKAFGAVIFHSNVEDPEAAVNAAKLASALREKFGIDVFLDLVGYRKYGHNESDEPFFTQPLLYKAIKQRPSIRTLYIERLLQEGSVTKEEVKRKEKEFKEGLQKALESAKEVKPFVPKDEEIEDIAYTPLTKDELFSLVKTCCHLPKSFHVHPKIRQLYLEREKAVLEGLPIDWGTAEMLAYAKLLSEGTSLRLTGQDVCRGTFSHRQALLIDQETGESYYPLEKTCAKNAVVSLLNSPLSEFAALGFEFGYSLAEPESLVIWEAQFGDFANGAQVIFDQYLSASEVKWGQCSSLVVFLPHGYEGQGPEHSSARLERFLTLCAEDNMQVVYPSTPAQLFHLLTQHPLKAKKKPLIVMTPKQLLRHPECVSQTEAFLEKNFAPVLYDAAPEKPLVFTTGKVYYAAIEKALDLFQFVRFEQLYPFPEKEVIELLARAKATQWIWLQEEPKNMGAYSYMCQNLQPCLPEGQKLIYVGREESATPAVGSYLVDREQEEAFLLELLKQGKQEE